MAITEGVGIVAAGKEARAKALAKSKQVTSDKKIAAEYKVDPFDKILRDIDKGFDRIRSQESTGGTKERGRGMGDTFDPTKDFSVKKPSFFSPGGGIYDSRNEVEVASTDLSGLTSDKQTTSTFGTSFTEQASANLADASIYQKKEDGIYRPSDNIYDDLKEITRPKIEKPKPYLDSSGDYFSKDPDKGGTLIQKSGDDMRFSQGYDRNEKGELTKNYQKEFASYLRSGESTYGSLPETSVKQLVYREKPKLTLGNIFGGTDGYIADPKMAGIMRGNVKYDFDNYRRDLVKTAAEKSPYGADVEVGKKRFDESTGVMGYKYDFDKAKFVDTEKKDMIQYRDIPKGEGYFFKDFYKPGEFRTKEDLNRYLTDRGAYMTGMPSNFEGGISGRGEKSDDLTSMYPSTAGDFKKENEKKEPSTLEKVGNFLGNVTNVALGIQPAGATQIGGPLPSGTETPTTGDTSFSAYVKGGGAGQERGTTTPTATPKQTVASLPSNYKQTEAAAFAAASAFQQAKKNPNVKAGVDSKGQVSIKPANNTAKAKAQAAALNRKASGKSISSVKASNRASMKKAAAARNASFQARKKAGKLSSSERTAKGQRAAKKAAARARAQAAAKKRRAKKKSKK